MFVLAYLDKFFFISEFKFLSVSIQNLSFQQTIPYHQDYSFSYNIFINTLNFYYLRTLNLKFIFMNQLLDKTKKILSVGLKSALALPFIASCANKEKPMNILFIMSDDHSYQTISAYDTSFIRTPNLDRIANEGVRFNNSFVANSISAPSRACLLTGKHSQANGFTDNSCVFDGSQQTFPKLIQDRYETAIIGKWHLNSDPTGFNHWDILIGQGD